MPRSPWPWPPLREAEGAREGLRGLSGRQPLSGPRRTAHHRLAHSHRRGAHHLSTDTSALFLCVPSALLRRHRHGTRESRVRTPDASVKPWPTTSLILSFLIGSHSEKGSCSCKSSQPKHFHPHLLPILAYPRARQDMECSLPLQASCLPLSTLRPSRSVSSLEEEMPREAKGLAASHTAHEFRMESGLTPEWATILT